MDSSLINWELRLSRINWSRMLHDSRIILLVSEATKRRTSRGVLECQAFSNDFVQNVKHSSETKMKINSMLMYEIGAFCSCYTAAFREAL